MTIEKILETVCKRKAMTRPTLYRHIRELGIKPRGVSQRPANYPEYTPKRVLKRLGL